jgi:MFS-type transporter involved in bile tolerance (Atg22 family)
VVFAFSAAMGAISLIFLKRIPDVEVPAEERSSRHPVPWAAIIGHPPFRKLLWAVVAWSAAYGGMSTFTVVFLKGEMAMSEGKVLLLNSTTFVGGWCSLWFLAPRLDRLGSKPVIGFSLTVWLLILAGWLCLSGGVWLPSSALVIGLMLLMGLFAALVQMAYTRLAMLVIPEMGRNHFFALYSVLGSVTLGLAPVLWGLVIDAFAWVHGVWLGLEWNRYSLFFAAVAVCMTVALALSRRLEEPEARGMDELLRDIFDRTPLRWWIRWWPRS